MFPKLRQYPRELSILGKPWKLRFCRTVPDPDPRTVGLCDYEARTIWIKLGLTPKDRFETFWHEIIHAAEFSAGCRLNHRTVYKVEKTLAAAFVENFVQMCELALDEIRAKS
jgi:hypothetical protein